MFDLSKMVKKHWGLLVVILVVSVLFFSFGRGCRGGVEQVVTREEVVAIFKSEIAAIKKTVAIEVEKKVIPKELPEVKIVLVPSLPKFVPKTIVVPIPVPRFVSPVVPDSAVIDRAMFLFDKKQGEARASFAKKQERDLAYKKRKLEEWCCSLSIVYYPPHYVVGRAMFTIEPGREKEFAQEMDKYKKDLEIKRLSFEDDLRTARVLFLRNVTIGSSRYTMYR